ncbi:hypothetical protein ACVDG3_12590 [Meridianimarinicoccus sp. RP-17]|uniref:hypothetical protein n=1 Tax=Meridianimarinicoccus zhengii TaxID=2056810 RepID=UPI000DAEBC1D|nr:hypothetical protein [Phycocomes zhengii]
MPNFDTGHLFLTFLAPIKAGTTTDLTGQVMSHEQALRITLGLLPTALQSPATIRIGENSPFARSLQTHLCRFVVIEDTIYNGRDPKDALVMSLRGQDPIHPQAVDRLNSAYLLFAADIDAVMEEGAPLPATLDEKQQGRVRDAWAKRLWDRMEPELRAVYDNCVGFDSVRTGDDFARYLKRCQVDTTMPFHDYWTSPPKLSPLPVKPLAAIAIVPLAATVLAFLAQLLGYMTPHAGWVALVGLAVSVAVLVGVYRYIVARGQNPMPPADHGDLPSVLKSLYLQQHFADFVVDRQGADADTLHAAFGDFLATHKPGDTMQPTQTPGVISARHGTS